MSKVLVVEDEALVGLELRETLSKLGYEVPPVVNNADKVIEEVVKHGPDLVLMDIRLKGFTDGIDAATRIKSFSSTPIIYLTAYSTPDVLGRALKTDPAAYLLKPFDDRQLQINIELALSRRKKQEAISETAFVRSILKGLQTPALVADREWGIMAANPAAMEILGYSEDESIIGQKLGKFVDTNALQQQASGSFASYTWTGPKKMDLHVRVEKIPAMGPGDGSQFMLILESVDPRERKLMENVGKDINSEIFALLPDPSVFRSGVEIAGSLLPSPSGSGDIYDIFSPDGRNQVFYLLDVMGHGTLPALFACMLNTMIRSLAEAESLQANKEGRSFSIPSLLQQVNQQYQRTEGANRFFTIAMGCLDTRTGNLSIVHAGHPSSIMADSKGIHHLKSSGNAAMGVFEDMEFQEFNGVMETGARVLLFSDGFLNRLNTNENSSIAQTLLTAGQIALEKRKDDIGICLQALLKQDALTKNGEEDASLFILEYTGPSRL